MAEPFDVVDHLLTVARSIHATPAQLRTAADFLESGVPTLRQAWDGELTSAQRHDVTKNYRKQVDDLLDGLPAQYDLPAVPGLGEVRITDLRASQLVVLRDAAQAHAAARLRQTRTPRSGASSRDGAGAARHLVTAGKNVAALLVQEHLLGTTPFGTVTPPPRPDPAREMALTREEVREYCLILVCNTADPVLTAVTWMLFRVLGARLGELAGLKEIDVKPTRPSVTLVGKGGRRRERAVHRPLLQLALDVMRDRPPAPHGELLRTARGAPFNRKRAEEWSQALHQHAHWASGFNIRVHTLRHTTAHLIRDTRGDSTPPASTWATADPARCG